jgi:hypothetical protein
MYILYCVAKLKRKKEATRNLRVKTRLSFLSRNTKRLSLFKSKKRKRNPKQHQKT